ncbi:MAG: hypothetical protein NVV82_23810 [Sporocytophaga sp.]|nr:hypothetical protein [Sporocytophaga sp.]
MKKLMLSWTLVLAVAGLTFMSCGKDKDDNKPDNPAESTFKDPRDSKEYKTIRIGNQTWFAENLAYVGPLSAGSSECKNGSVDSCAKYGRRYTGDAAKVACPSGWHLPSDAEWKVLEKYFGMSDADLDKVGFDFQRGEDNNVAGKLTKGGSSKFEALNENGPQAIFWTSTDSPTMQYARSITPNENAVYRFESGDGTPTCVRCLKD